MIEIKIYEKTREAIEAAGAALANREPLMARVGKRVETVVRDHFRDRESEPNKQGWPSRHFWSSFAASTLLQNWDQQKAVVAIAHPAIYQKIFGGKITPKRGKYLTIPAIAAAYAAGSPREGATPPLAIKWVHDPKLGCMRPALVERKQTAAKTYERKGKKVTRRTYEEKPTGSVWYWLVKSVTQSPDPRTLPQEESIQTAIASETRAFIDQVFLHQARSATA